MRWIPETVPVGLRRAAGIALACAALGAAVPAQALIVPLVSGNSSVEVDLTAENLFAPGALNWRVNGAPGGNGYMPQQSFFFRINGGDIRSLAFPFADLDGTFGTPGTCPGNPSPDAGIACSSTQLTGQVNALQTRYLGFDPAEADLFAPVLPPVLQFDLFYELIGGGLAGTPRSQLKESISITNLSQAALTLDFFQYVNFDLAGTSGDTVSASANRIDQKGGGITADVTTDTPADFFQASIDGSLGFPFLLTALDPFLQIFPLVGDLDNTGGPLAGLDFFDDAHAAWQWSFELAAGESFNLGLTKSIPEPSALSLVLVAFLGGRALWKKSRAWA